MIVNQIISVVVTNTRNKIKEVFNLDYNRYDNINDILESNYKIYKKNKIEYINLACSFDIETSSFYVNDEKRACMYMWGIGINGCVCIKRTWEEFQESLKIIANYYKLNESRRMIIYVHNLAYEFQFMRKWLEWKHVFAIDERKPLYTVDKMGFEFRCSYLLSGYSLAKIGEHLTKYKVNKLVGALNYDLIRHSKTDITKLEYDYLINDNLVVMAYIQEYKERLGGYITRIQYTKTGVIRKITRENCYNRDPLTNKRVGYKYKDYLHLIQNLIIKSPEEYLQLKRAFCGGFTHANCNYVSKGLNNYILENVTSFDFSSAYPYCLCAFEYPMSSAQLVTIKSHDELEKYLKCYCCVFDIEFINLESKILYEHYLSESKCIIEGERITDNGRVVKGADVITTITNVDFEIIRKVYKWDKMKIKNFRIYHKAYLPKDIILTILKLYSDKTKLKGVEGMEVEYQSTKENINSVYGSFVMSIVRPEYNYEGTEWKTTTSDIKEELDLYNKSKKRFNFYPWGVFCTAYCRRNLWTGIISMQNKKTGYSDYVYSDTDAIKILNKNEHLEYINKYNEMVINNLKTMCDILHIDFNLCAPKTNNGKIKMLGVWDEEETFIFFKTLGAKRYMTYYDNKLSYTISGVSKKTGVPYLLDKYNNDIKKIFNYFNDDFFIPKEHTGKMTHTYIDEEINEQIYDYKGVLSNIHELSYIHLEKCEFSLSISSSFKDFLESFRFDFINN